MSERKIAKEIKGIKQSIGEIKDKSDSLDPNSSKVNNPQKPSNIRTFEIIGIIMFLYFFGQSIISFFFPLFEIIYSTLVTFDSSIVWPPLFNISALLITILLYYNAFVYGIWQLVTKGFNKALENFSNNVQKWQLWIIIPIALVLFLEIGFLQTNQGETYFSLNERSEDIGSESQSTFNKFLNEIQCSFNPQCFLREQNEEEDTQNQNTAYSMKIEDSLSTYRESQLKNREFPINLEVQSKGGNLFLQKLECYIGEPIKENLIDTKNLNNREIENTNPSIVGGLSCDLSSIEVKGNNSQREDIIITPIIYYTLELEYTQEISLIDYQEYKEEQDKEISIDDIRNDISIQEPKNSAKNALSISRRMNPPLPIVVNHPDIRNSNYFMDLTFEKQNSNLGEINATKLTSIQYPQNYITFNNLETPYTIESYDGITETSFQFNTLISTLSQESQSQIMFPIKMTFENTLEKEDSINFALVKDR